MRKNVIRVNVVAVTFLGYALGTMENELRFCKCDV